MKNLTILCIVFSLFMAACIRKECRDIPGGYHFVLPVAITPILDTFRIGDTILIRSTFSNQVYEMNTARYYELINFRFDLSLTAVQLDTIDGDENGIQSFQVLENTDFEFRQYSNGVSAYVGQYEYDNGNYSTELRIIPEKAGLFVVSLAALMIDENQRFAGKCNGIGSSAVMAHENPEQMNIEFLTESPDPHYSEWTLQRPQERFYDAGGYCFYVAE